MPIFDNNSYTVRSLYERQDADGKIFLYCRSHGALTAATPYVIYCNYDGPKTLALWDTTLASTTAAGSNNFYRIGVPPVAVSSDTDGWLQIGWYCASLTVSSLTPTAGSVLRWVDAAVATGNPIASVSSSPIDAFAVAYTTASAATNTTAAYLLNRFVMGTT